MSVKHPRVTATLLATALALAAAAPAIAHGDAAHTQAPPQEIVSHEVRAELTALRKAMSKYGDVDAATAAGYIPVSPCEESAQGGMGFHYLNPALVGSLDPAAPTVLLYEPTKDGDLRLVGVEYFAVDADQDVSTDGDRPSLWGKGFDGPMVGHSPDMPVHYDLHVWLYKHNPDGVFAAWNPRVSC